MYIKFDECVKKANGKIFKTILHIGAHYGQEIQAYAENSVKKVVWIDANKRVFRELINETASYSSIEQHYLCACLSDQKEEVQFHIANNGTNNTDGQSSSLLELGTHAKMYPHITYVDHQKVTTQRFDEWHQHYTDRFKIEEIDFVNLDVQGAELKVLKGFGDLLALPTLRAIYTEINLEEVYKGCCQIEDLDDHLKQYGFRRALVATPEHSWGDAFYLK